ncbi:MAG: Ig-like domain-containing protein, partial [Bacteroidales bacterium]|nr:Ig-like domain-containing protein [Bacteroidales bacterium]
LIHWGSVTGNDEIRDLGIYLYTTEQTAIEEYWLDMHERNFKADQHYSLVSRVWGNSYDNGTFWTADIAASYGIEMYPIHGGSLYLGQNHAYVDKLWTEITENTGILNNQANPNLWHDVMWEYLAFIDPAKAIEMYDSYPERELKFGITDVQTYHWLHAMNAMGQVDATVTADYPIAAVFNNNGERTYTAHNYTKEAITVNFSDGATLDVPANSMANSKDINLKASISSAFSQAFTGGNIPLTVTIDEGTASKVEFFDGGKSIGEKNAAPYTFNATELSADVHGFYAKVFDGKDFIVTNIIPCTVGRQQAYSGTPTPIPGTLEPGHYDKYEGGNGQGITYNDVSQNNEGDFRTDEYVDAQVVNGEGAIVGWISAGEWMSYTVNVETPGLYKLSFRYASGNNSGGGPFNIEFDGEVVADNITVSSSNGWDKFTNKTVTDIPLKAGENILRLNFSNGELNLGKLTFTYSAPLGYDQPIANAGDNVSVLLPTSTATLDASQSSNPGSASLTYRWSQVYGPSIIAFSDNTVEKPNLSSLVEGVYLLNLRVNNGTYSDNYEFFVFVSNSSNLAPSVSITSPEDGADFISGKTLTITAQASDFDGSIKKVEFYADEALIATDTEAPYETEWTPSSIKQYALSVKATDDKDSQSSSATVAVNITQAPSCEGTSDNGDFNYQFSDDASNPTLTFIPSESGVGSPTCILYYGTGAGPFPGYMVTPNTPFRINAEAGSTINFYYTYSFPGYGEKNTADKLISYVVGSCSNASGINDTKISTVMASPNPVETTLTLNIGEIDYQQLHIHSMTGQLIKSFIIESGQKIVDVDMYNYPSGMYLITLESNTEKEMLKIIKE